MKVHQLDNTGESRSLVFAMTSDGAKITNHLHHAIASFKIVDPAAIDPMTKRFTKPQSLNVCRPVRVVLGKETEEIHTSYVNPMRNWWDDCDSTNEENIRSIFHFPNLKAFNLSCANDMSAG